MKKVGIIGGTGPESTVDYYKSIISKVQDKLNNHHVLPEILINSIDMYNVFQFIESDQLDRLTDYLSGAVRSLEAGGADFTILSANTTHIVFDDIQKEVTLPMISIVEETLKEADRLGLKKIGLIGTKFTMENDFFKKPFTAKGKTVITPTPDEQSNVHKKIVEELEIGMINMETKREFLTVIERMIEEDHIQGLILGCTELPMLLKADDSSVPLLNTTDIHVDSIVRKILEV